MPVSIINSEQYQFKLLHHAAQLTMSEGFMRDAHGAAAYDEAKDKILAIAVFQNHSTRSVEMHFAATDPGALRRRDVIMAFCAFAFNPRFLGAPRITAPIATWNERAIVAAMHVGFQITGFLGGGALDGSNAILMTLDRDTCRWLPPPMPATRTVETHPA
jgi:hypothetical protein